MLLDGKSSQEYSANAGYPQSSVLGSTLFLLYIKGLPENVICIIAIHADDITIYAKCDQVSHLWQQLGVASELKYELWDTGLGQEATC